MIAVGITLILQCRTIHALQIWGRRNRGAPPSSRPPQLPPFMAPVEDAISKLQTEALARIDNGKRGLESASKAYDVSRRPFWTLTLP